MIINTLLYRRLLKYIVPYWGILTLALLGMVVMAFILSMLPAFIMQLLDSIFINKDQELIRFISLTIVALFIVHGVANYIGITAINMVGCKLGVDLRVAMFNKLLSLPARYYTEITESELTTRFISDLNKITHATINVITILVKDSLTMIGLLGWMFYLNQELSLLILLITSAIILVTQLISGYFSKTSQQTLKATGEITQVLFKSIKNLRLIKLYGGLPYENHRFMNKAEQMLSANMNQTSTKMLSIVLSQILIVIILTAITHLIIQQVYNDEITLGEIASLIIATLMLVISLKRVSCITKYLLQGQQALENVFSLLDQTTEEDTGTVTIKRAHGELVFDKVSFCYDTQTQPVLHNFNLTIKPGEIVVLTGMTESDRMALFDLILRFLHPTHGRILLDGHDLANLKLTSLHANIALVPQKVTLFDDTAAINVAYGEMECTNEARITAAAQASHAIKFIREMPEGLQTIIGEHGEKLTETQCQHIAIARALLKDPPILLLDEISTESDYLEDALKTLMQGRTTLILTRYPPTTLEKIDRMIMLKNGHATEIKGHGAPSAKQKN